MINKLIICLSILLLISIISIINKENLYDYGKYGQYGSGYGWYIKNRGVSGCKTKYSQCKRKKPKDSTYYLNFDHGLWKYPTWTDWDFSSNNTPWWYGNY